METKHKYESFAADLVKRFGHEVLKKQDILVASKGYGFSTDETYRNFLSPDTKVARGRYSVAKWLTGEDKEKVEHQKKMAEEFKTLPIFVLDKKHNKIVPGKPIESMTHDEWVTYHIAYQTHRHKVSK